MPETAFILAGGASVAGLDLSFLAGHYVVAINSAWKSYPAADALFFADYRWWKDPKLRPDGFGGLIVTIEPFPDGARLRKEGRAVETFQKIDPALGISRDPAKLALNRSSVTGAINWLWHHGFRLIGLLGVDGKVAADGRRHHHGDRYPWPMVDGCFDGHAAEFARVAPSIAAAGAEVVNLNPDSAIGVWPKMRLEEFVADAGTRRAGPSVKPKLAVRGMFGMGDCLHQRAVLRALMRTHEVTVETYYTSMFHDLIADGLKLHMLEGLKAPIRDAGNAVHGHPGRVDRRIGYDGRTVKANGSILAATFASVGLRMPARPDFSLPVLPEWREAARKLVGDTGGRPLMVYRPIVQNRNWDCPSRAPDPAAYAELYQAVRDRFFVVSVSGGEAIVGEEQDADLKLHQAEADFEALAGLFAEADLVFGNAGFAPVLAQAVGTPVVCAYGGHDSFATTNSVGAHLAPTLAIEPIKVCGCHDRHHDCDKRIDVPAQKARLEAFVGDVLAGPKPGRPKVLIFGTTYVDSEDRALLTRQWAELHRHLNADCDFLLVDSASPDMPAIEGLEIFDFGDNIGHLSRRGRDGWGRAFCRGLQVAIERGYDYAVHIEGDSLFRLPVMPIVEDMRRSGTKVATVPVEGTRRKEVGWVETGLMFFEVGWLKEKDFVRLYDWPNRQERPTPEKVIFGVVGDDLRMMPWKAERGDKSHLTVENVTGLDWVTHCHGAPEVTTRFVEHVLGKPKPLVGMTRKLNFGCGKNRITGWDNYDAEVDISQPLPFDDASADLIFAEHVVEHVGYYQALDFFKECLRVLKPGGVIRICVPSLENIWKRGDEDYFRFASKWGPSADRRGAMHAILYAHGHQAAWTQGLLEASLYYAGFDGIEACEPGKSRRSELVGVEGHARIIGERRNWIESAVAEGVRP